MIEVQPKLWLGCSNEAATLSHDAILNVAHDLRVTTYSRVYAQCGLVDGPGSPISAYYSATLMLHVLRCTDSEVLVLSHDLDARCVTVTIMYLHLMYRRGWAYWHDYLCRKLGNDMHIHDVHLSAFNRMNWRLLSLAIEEK